MQYNLEKLGHEEFEELSQSLVQKIIGPGVKVYGMGSDGAREATFQGKAPYPSTEEHWDGFWIFQAKFHNINQIGQKNARAKLLKELDEELETISKLNYKCENYILITNVSLSPLFRMGTKDKIDNEIIPKYPEIRNIHVWGAEEVSRFLDAYPEIRKTYDHLLLPSDIIALLIDSIKKDDATLAQTIKLYCQGCFDNERCAVLDDAGDMEDKLPLEQVFIDLDVKPVGLPPDPRYSDLIPDWLKEAYVGDRTSALSYLLDDKIQGLVLVGGPGSGKSTLGQGIAQIHRGCIIGKIVEFRATLGGYSKWKTRLPFRILLREYAQWVTSQLASQKPDSLFYYVSGLVSKDSGGREVSPEALQKITEKIPILLILDGLDEVSDKKLRAKVLDNINSFTNQVRDILNGDLRIIGTTRPHGYSEEFDPKHFLHLNLQKVSFEKASGYARLWANSRVSPSDIERTIETFKLCIKDKVVGILSQTPLQITILLVIIRARGTPPKQREELFDRYMDIIYQRETKRRPELLQTDRELIYGLHKYIGYILHKRAERDATAALMDASEFKEKVTEYLVNTNPLLEGMELENKANQIMREAGLRLVLLEGLQDGKIGFGLTSVREFFAAAHLVDTAKNTLESDNRFKAIATLPHWRNVALFFAGRVGRNRPGEAPSMIDICRSIDIEGVDRFLKRGANLVSEIVDDRDMREPHNEISAIQYCLILVDSGYVEKPEEFAGKLKNLPNNYKEKIILPMLEDKLKNSSVNLEKFIFYYQRIFGNMQPLRDALTRITANGTVEKKKWVLSQILEYGIAEPWTIRLLEELSALNSGFALRAVSANWTNLSSFLSYKIDDATKAIIGAGILEGSLRRRIYLEIEEEKLLLHSFSNFEKIKDQNQSYLLIKICLLTNLLMRHAIIVERRQSRGTAQFIISLPPVFNPEVKNEINSNKQIIDSFVSEFSKIKEPFYNLMVSFYLFISNPENPDHLKQLREIYKKYPTQSIFCRHVIKTIAGELIENECKQDAFNIAFSFYKNNKNFYQDMRSLSDLFNGISTSKIEQLISVYSWIDDRLVIFEEGIEPLLQSKLRDWLNKRNFTKDFLALVNVDFNFRYNQIIRKEMNSPLFVNSLVDKLIEQVNLRKRLPTFLLSSFTESDIQDEKTREKICSLFSLALEKYAALNNADFNQLESLYWSFLGIEGVITEDQMVKLYTIFHMQEDLPKRFWRADSKESIKQLLKFAKSANLEVARLACVSLQKIQDDKIVLPQEIGEVLWDLSKDKKDYWNKRYLRNMAKCKLEWTKNFDTWLENIKNAEKDGVEGEWSEIIERAGYAREKDKVVLLNLLIQILDKSSFSKKIKESALRRLSRYSIEIQSTIDESSLSLPLPKRKGLCIASKLT